MLKPATVRLPEAFLMRLCGDFSAIADRSRSEIIFLNVYIIVSRRLPHPALF
jgi:hypothetical protein